MFPQPVRNTKREVLDSLLSCKEGESFKAILAFTKPFYYMSRVEMKIRFKVTTQEPKAYHVYFDPIEIPWKNGKIQIYHIKLTEYLFKDINKMFINTRIPELDDIEVYLYQDPNDPKINEAVEQISQMIQEMNTSENNEYDDKIKLLNKEKRQLEKDIETIKKRRKQIDDEITEQYRNKTEKLHNKMEITSSEIDQLINKLRY